VYINEAGKKKKKEEDGALEVISIIVEAILRLYKRTLHMLMESPCLNCKAGMTGPMK
jgi:hypothetical protein